MKQYLDKDQTAKLMELGFPKPKHALPIRQEGQALIHALRYTTEELIEFLPRWIKPRGGLEIVAESDGWLVMHGHDPFDPYCKKVELIDALFEYCVKIKEEGLI